MSIFNFIIDEQFRSSLESDLDELQKCLDSQSWKAAHVLSGSLIEAVLIDSIVSEGGVPRKDALSMDLGQAVDRAKQAKILSAKVADLCSAVRAYRNLIHPGRSIRLDETVDRDSATVAGALVRIIVAEVAKKRLEAYGYTAEQLLAKLEKDPSVEAILTHLLKETKPTEVERLLVSVLPARYFSAFDDVDAPSHLLRALENCFRTAFGKADDETKRRVARRFVVTLKEESEAAILSYWTAFFRATDMAYLSDGDIELVRDHLLARCKANPSSELFVTLEGIGAHLKKGHIARFVDPLIRLATASSSDFSEVAKNALISEFGNTSDETDKLIAKRLASWVEAFRSKNQLTRLKVAEELKSLYDSDIPF